MATAKSRFKIFDIVTATDLSIQLAHVNGFVCPPTDEVTVVAIRGDELVLSDSSQWHHSHFKKVGENTELQGAVADLTIFDELEGGFEGDFDEQEYIDELRDYIANTYGQHYAKDGVQTFELISKRPLRGLYFALGNCQKYSDRFGEKDGMNRKDILKVAHYAILALYAYDQWEAANAKGK